MNSRSRKFRNCLTLQIIFLLSLLYGVAQETTGGLQGTVRDPSGAVVSKANVVLTGSNLVGQKSADTDQSGYYRFANLPPGAYTLSVSGQGFSTLKREGLIIEVGHLPTVDLTLEVGATSSVVEVNGAAPSIDVTTETTQTNVTSDVIDNVPHGRSFQSVIQFAPSARNEPLEGSTILSNGTGGTSPGNGSNGGDHGFSVAGGSDSENSYLVEGQETANLIGGYSHTNVPFEFIQEVQIKSSGIEAEHGGALGGVVNVIMNKGSNSYHGSLFTSFEKDALDGSPTSRSRYNDLSTGSFGGGGQFIDPAYENYQPLRRKTSDVFPGFTFGGPIIKNRIFFFTAFNPEWNNQERTVNYGPTNGGLTKFSSNQQTYYSTARIDAAVSEKVRVFGSWLYQYQRETGQALPRDDSTSGFFNPSTGCFGPATSASNPCQSSGTPQFVYSHSLGYSAPNVTTNVGADITLTPHIVATTRFGYYFENYHDFGYPTSGTIYNFQASGIGGTDALGQPLPATLQQSFNYLNVATSANYTARNANKAVQFDADVAWFKSLKGSHNFKFGYQLNRLSNDIFQRYNEPYVQVFPGNGGAAAYQPLGDTGNKNCAPFQALYAGNCQGQYGYISVYDAGSAGKVTSLNHGLFVQDAWTIGHGITINAGVRFDKEYLPGESQGPGVPSKPINFNWTDKIAPRLGAAWDVFKDGRMKVFGGYGEFYDIMKLNVAISSFGGQYWQQCYYALDTANLSSINPVFASNGRYCAGDSTGQANFGGAAPAGLTFLENQNFRLFPTTCSTCSLTQEGVVPGLKPYKQHESVFGVDYQLAKTLAFEARWDRRRLDHVIEDSAIYSGPLASETFVIVNPGQGVNRTFDGFCNFLYGASASTACASATRPPNTIIPAARSYDGAEFRLTKVSSAHWSGMFSYTYSHLRGNYTGLTSTDIADGGVGGRNSPNNSRAFDEPYFSWNANGGSSSGPLPTDRPHTFKGWGYYDVPWSRFAWSHGASTDFGAFQYFYQGSPTTSYMDVGAGGSAWPVDVVNRGKYVDVSQDINTGLVTVGAPRTFRTPWYIQTDFNLQQNFKWTETKAFSFGATVTNLFNQHSVTAYNGQIDTGYDYEYGRPPGPCSVSRGTCSVGSGVPFYAAAEAPYNIANLLNFQNNLSHIVSPVPVAVNSQYGKPLFFQQPRTIRLSVHFTF